MRHLFSLTAFTLVLILCLASPLAAKGGKGGGKGKGGGSAASRGPASGPQARGGQQRGGHRAGHEHGSAAERQQLADTHKKPAQDKHPKNARRGDHEQGQHHHEQDGQDRGDEGEVDETTPYNKKEQQLANFQRQRDQKLAQADHLRQIAQRNGNENLLANADRMEAQALDEYARKASRLEKFGVSDPALNPGGVSDPVAPNVDPVVPDPQPAATRTPVGRSSWWPFRW